MSQVVTLRFTAMPTFEAVLEEWHTHGTTRRFSASAVELCPTTGSDTVLVNYSPEKRELSVEGSFCEATWGWLDEVRRRYRGTLIEEEVGLDEKAALLNWRTLAWYWKALVVLVGVLLLPVLLPFCLLYALWQLGRVVFILKK